MLKRILCLFLVLVTLFLLSACTIDSIGKNFDENDITNVDDTDGTNGTDDTGTSDDGTQSNEPSRDEIIDEGFDAVSFLSYDPEDYIGDLETFAYGLLINELEYIYDVFPACVQLSDSYFVYGLAYTDYTECYTNDDESEAYFMSGFLPFVGELDIPEEDFDSGLYIHDLEYEDESTKFVWKYRSDAFLQHCVVYGAYLQYGVDSNGYITYNAIPYEREKCDISLGALYSYDDSRYLYDVDFGNYTPISGISLAVDIDYAELEREINAIIEEQNANFMTYDIETVAYTSQDAVVSFLLSMQEESFLGYSVDLLVEAAKELNPLECFRITTDGLSVVDISEIPPEEPTALCKWLVGTACVIAIAVGMAGSVIYAACPPLSALAGAVTGAAIETFMQVIIENKTLADVSWTKVAIAAVSGAVSGLLGPYIQATFGGVSYFLIDSAIDGIIGGIEQAVFAWMDGKSGKEILSSFGYGFAIGAGLSAAFKVGGKILSAGAKKFAEFAGELSKKLPSKLTSAATKFVKPVRNIGSAIGDSLNKLKQKADSSIFHSNYISKRMLEKAARENSSELLEKSIKKLSNNEVLDNGGNVLNKTKLRELYKNAKDGDILGYIKKDDGVVAVIKKNGAIGVTFPDNQSVKLTRKNYGSPEIDKKNIRKNNLEEARELLAKKWILDPDSMPEDIAKRIKLDYPDENPADVLENMLSGERYKTKLEDWIDGSSDSKWALHEELELGVVSLVPKSLHSVVKGGTSHMGGAALEAYLKQHMGGVYFETLINAAASGLGINAGGIYAN